MEKYILLLFTLISSFTFSQEKTIKTKVNSATVFLNSAQVNRATSVNLTKGENTLKFIALSPFISKKSIQVKASDIEIEAISFKKNFLKSTKNKKIAGFETMLKITNDKIDAKKVDLSIVQEEISFLKANRNVGGKNQNLTLGVLKSTSEFYSNKIKTLKTSEFSIQKEIIKLEYELSKIEKQIREVSTLKDFGSGEITIKLNAKSAGLTKFELSYNISNVGWKPSYDIKVKDIKSPLQLIYKANLKQNSQVDWNNVKLRFSSANPSQATKVQKVKPYFLNYGTYPPNYSLTKGNVQGKVNSVEGPLPGVSVVVKGTTIGTETDFDGNYSLELPVDKNTLVFSYLGYKAIERPVYNNTLNVFMQEDENSLDEVVVVGYGTNRKRQKKDISKTLEGKASGLTIRGRSSLQDNVINTKKVIKQTTVSFEIVKPYSITSSNKSVSIPIKNYNHKASYQYFAFPKADLNAYLVASISDWEEMNLLEGEANIYFEDTFVGTSLLDTRTEKKKLEISLGLDKNVQIERKKIRDFTTRQFIGNKKQEIRAWNFSVKNNKMQDIAIIITDQIPISTRAEITIELDTKVTKGKLNKDTGAILWQMTLTPKEVKAFQLKYAVKYPKNARVHLD